MNLLNHTVSALHKKLLAVILLLAVFGSGSLLAQQGTLNRDHNEQVTIVGTYDPTINQAFKINLKPDLPEVVTQKPDFTFYSLDIKQPTTIEPVEINPARLRASKKITIYNNYLKAGFGSWFTPTLNFYHASGKKNDSRLNILFNHISSFKDIPDYSPSPFSNSKASISYDKNIGKSILNVGATYGLDTYQYYGFMPDDYPTFTANSDDLKQMFNLIKGNVGLRSNNKKSKSFEYNTNLGVFYYFDKWQTSTLNANLDFDFSQPFDAGKRGNNQKVGLKGKVGYWMNADSTTSSNDLILTGIPYYKAKFGMVNFSVGLNFSYTKADSLTYFDFYPVIDVAVILIPDALTIYAGVDGGMVQNSFYELTQINPWSSSVIPVGWQNNKLKAYAGLRGNIARQLGYNFEVSWLNFENMPFFINIQDNPIWGASTPLNKFTAAFDDGNLLKVGGELNYALGSELNIWLGGSYNIYTLDSLSEPYHKPLSNFNLGASYLIKKKVKVWAEFIGSGKRYAVDIYTPTPTQIDLDGYFDINLGVDVYITEQFSVFVKGTNLLNKNYERFYNYPVQGLQVFGGIGYRF